MFQPPPVPLGGPAFAPAFATLPPGGHQRVLSAPAPLVAYGGSPRQTMQQGVPLQYAPRAVPPASGGLSASMPNGYRQEMQHGWAEQQQVFVPHAQPQMSVTRPATTAVAPMGTAPLLQSQPAYSVVAPARVEGIQTMPRLPPPARQVSARETVSLNPTVVRDNRTGDIRHRSSFGDVFDTARVEEAQAPLDSSRIAKKENNKEGELESMAKSISHAFGEAFGEDVGQAKQTTAPPPAPAPVTVQPQYAAPSARTYAQYSTVQLPGTTGATVLPPKPSPLGTSATLPPASARPLGTQLGTSATLPPASARPLGTQPVMLNPYPANSEAVPHLSGLPSYSAMPGGGVHSPLTMGPSGAGITLGKVVRTGDLQAPQSYGMVVTPGRDFRSLSPPRTQVVVPVQALAPQVLHVEAPAKTSARTMFAPPVQEIESPPRSSGHQFRQAQPPTWARDDLVAPAVISAPVAGFLLTMLI